MIYGETVFVSEREFGVKDAFGNEVKSYATPYQVTNVLVGRGSVRDESNDGRPYTVRTDISFCFPRGFDGDLRGALVECRGKHYELVDSYELTDANIPPDIPWNRRAEGGRVDG